jgi:hypothetical protein
MNEMVVPTSSKRTGDAHAARERYSYDRGDFTWRRHQDGTWALHVEGRRGAVLHVVRDEAYPQMWRIRHLDGRLSDMANLTWAKDGAIAVAMHWLDPRKVSRRKAEQSRLAASPMRQIEEAATLSLIAIQQRSCPAVQLPSQPPITTSRASHRP